MLRTQYGFDLDLERLELFLAQAQGERCDLTFVTRHAIECFGGARHHRAMKIRDMVAERTGCGLDERLGLAQAPGLALAHQKAQLEQHAQCALGLGRW